MKMQARVGQWKSVGEGSTDILGETMPSKSKQNSLTSAVETECDPFVSWESHTRGFGSRMLQRMGYRHGQGLRADGSGLVK